MINIFKLRKNEITFNNNNKMLTLEFSIFVIRYACAKIRRFFQTFFEEPVESDESGTLEVGRWKRDAGSGMLEAGCWKWDAGSVILEVGC